MHAIAVSASCARRLERARSWLEVRSPVEQVLVVADTLEAASDVVRSVHVAAGGREASFGWERVTLSRLAAALAAPRLVEAGLVPVSPFAHQALCTRVVHELRRRGALGRFEAVAERPGLARALARALAELRMAGLGSDAPEASEIAARLRAVRPELAAVHEAYEAELARAGLADRALVVRLATRAIREARAGAERIGWPMLLVDVAVESAAVRELVAALGARSPDVLATVPAGDARTLRNIERALGVASEALRETPIETALDRLQQALFDEQPRPPAALDHRVTVLAAPGEARECVEIARILQQEAGRGVAFDRMAILLRAPSQYRPHVEEALRRAAIPAHFAEGVRQPDPAGRALLALLGCAAEGLSARRFAEYLSLGEVPDATPAGAPPAAWPDPERWVIPDEEMLPSAVQRARDDEGEDSAAADAEPAADLVADPAAARVVDGRLRSPRRWEQLLVDAAVIGGRSRWERRLATLRRELELDIAALEDPDDPVSTRLRFNIAALDALRDYALPLLDALDALPQGGTWGAWVSALTALATRALRRPERVLAVLSELEPMARVGPVSLDEVRRVLEPRLCDLVAPSGGRRFGRVYVAPIALARGLTFDVVFVPGLAERLFPQKVIEDPLLRDADRRAITTDLATSADRIDDERLALRLGAGAARERLVVSYPRIDLEQARPRVPSFYGLEVVRAAEGRLPGFDELARRADAAGTSRLGWPAPARAPDAIDEAEYDLALIESLGRVGDADSLGAAHYLLGANEHLARALRFRARRWHRRWHPSDGLVAPTALARKALDAHLVAARSFSPTALETFAACPYKFFLYAVHKLSPREEPVAIEELDALQRGSLVHEVLFELMVALRDAELLPLVPERLERARELLGEVLDRVAARTKEELAPAIERVWLDAIASVRADLGEVLRRMAADRSFAPYRFELAFGLRERRARDAASRPEPVVLENGLRLRGSIDLVERSADGRLRATDYKTGKPRAERGSVIRGGAGLQPILYALALEKLFPDAIVDGGRLYYCTSAADFHDVVTVLDQRARDAADLVTATIGGALERGFLPAAPAPRACELCDYRVVCGPHEEVRATRYKSQAELAELAKLRGHA